MTEHVREDSKILTLFRDWVSEVKRSEALPNDVEYEDKHFEANAREHAIQDAIFDLPSTSLRGFAIKVYLEMRDDGRLHAKSGAVYRDSDEDTRWNSILDDIARLVPELAAFVKVRRPDDADRDELGFFKNAPPGSMTGAKRLWGAAVQCPR